MNRKFINETPEEKKKRTYAYQVAWRSRNPSWRKYKYSNYRKYDLKHNYGMTQEAYDTLNSAQCGKCLICFKSAQERRKSDTNLVVDHDHVTGKIRGLLCGRCNSAIGMFRDKIELLEKAIIYLESNASV